MIIDDLWDSHGPSRAGLKVVDRLGDHREAFEALRPRGMDPRAAKPILDTVEDGETITAGIKRCEVVRGRCCKPP